MPSAARLAARSLVVCGIALLLGACGREPPPNVVLITLDTTRADRIGSYGYGLAHTPTIDRLAAEGVQFDNAQATAPITAPSHASIFTGLLPPAHGVRDNGAFALSEDAVTLAERFAEAGYETRALVSAVVLNRRYRLDQGFEVYDDDLWSEDDPKLFMIRERPAQQTIERTLEWYDARPAADAKPFFLWVHLFDPHQPMTPPAWTAGVAPTSYDREIAGADRELGRLVEALRARGELDRTVFVFTSDHGESLGEHEEKTHAIFVYQATTRVPLIIRYPPAFAAGSRYAGPVRSIDIAPTVLTLAGLPGADTTQGVDLGPLARGEMPMPDLPQYSESMLAELGFGMAPLFALRKDGHTFIRAPRPELYDLAVDPGETNNLYGDPARLPRADALDLDLEQLMRDSSARALASQGDPMSEETMQILQSLGYLQGEADRSSAGGMDPKDGIVLYNRLEEARHAAQASQWPRAKKLLEAILADHPRHFSARSVLALVEFKSGHPDVARDHYLQLIAQDPRQFRLYSMLGQIAMGEGDLDAAERHNREALAVAPQFVEAMSQLGLIALIRGDAAAAQDWYDRALAIDPALPALHRRMADLRFEQGDFAAALDGYREAYRRNPQDVRSVLQAGASARRAGRFDDAAGLLQQAIELRPRTWVPYYNLACLHAMQGQRAEALATLRLAIERHGVSAALLDMDGDWDGLRALPEFVALRDELARAEAAAEQAPATH